MDGYRSRCMRRQRRVRCEQVAAFRPGTRRRRNFENGIILVNLERCAHSQAEADYVKISATARWVLYARCHAPCGS